MAEVPDDLRYTETHEWIRVEDDEVLVGITDYAQSELSDLVHIDLPNSGRRVKKGEPLGTIEAVKAVSDLYAPISGEVVAVNQELAGSPELVNKDPYGKGWMVRLKVSDPGELDLLLSPAQYRKLIAQPS